jgi:hypothetical protein
MELPTSNQFRHGFMLSRKQTRYFDIVAQSKTRRSNPMKSYNKIASLMANILNPGLPLN